MIESAVRQDESLESLVARVIDEYRERQKNGEKPDIEEYATRHPEAAELLRKVLASWQLIGLSSCGGRDHPGMAEEPASGVLGDFRILREIGHGGMGVVYEAEQISLSRRVALKVLPFASTMDPRRLQRFINEAKAAACLHHTNIVPVFAVGSERGVHFYSMQLIDGHTLAAVIHDLQPTRTVAAPEPREGPATLPYQPAAAGASTAPRAALTTSKPGGDAAYFRKVAEIGVAAAEALDYAHQMGVVHRDIKPGNLMVDGHGTVWITDFGLAQLQTDAGLTLTGDLMGTLRYMSPEQALAKRVPIDHRTDIYSLGATLYELLTLRPVIAGDDRQEILRRLAFDEPIRPRRLNRAIPAELEIIVLKTLEKSPDDRFLTAQKLANDLRNWLEDRPLQLRRPSLWQRSRKWARRHKPAVTAAALLLLAVLLLGGSGLGWSQWQQAVTKREVGEFVQKAEILQQQERWPETLEMLGHADGRLVGSGLTDLEERVRRLRREVRFVAELEEARLQVAAAGKQEFDYAGADRLYAAAFARHSFDLEVLSPEEAAMLIRASPIRNQLLAALEDWASVKEALRTGAGQSRLALTRLADDDSWRNQLRNPLVWRDRTALERLAAEEGVLNQPTANLVQLSEILVQAGSAAKAEQLLRAAQQRHPGDFWINFELARRLLFQPAKKKESLEFWRAALAIRPNSPVANYNLGYALGQQKRFEEAEAAHRKAIELKPDYAEAYNSLGVMLSDQGKMTGAQAAYRKAIELKPDYADAYDNLGNTFNEQGRLAEAEAAHRKAIELDPKGFEAYTNLGATLDRLGNHKDAEVAHRKAIELNPKFAQAYTNLGITLARSGKLEDAVAAHRKAIELRPDYAEPYYNLGITLGMQNKNLADAVEAYRKAIQLKPDYASAYNNLGGLFLRLEKFPEAEQAYRKTLELRPDDATTYFNLGLALADQGKLEKAETVYRKAIELEPDFAQAYYDLGITLGKQNGKLAEAEIAYRKAIEYQPDYAEAHCNLGNLLRKQGRFVEGLAESKRGHTLGSQNPRWPYPSAEWVRQTERLVEIDEKLPQLLNGEVKTASAAESFEIARFCQEHKKLYHAAVLFYEEAFAAQPRAIENLRAQNRYNAACAAALAGCGQGNDANKLNAKEQLEHRNKALSWLRADLVAWRSLWEKEPVMASPAVRKTMQHWQQDADFSGIRGEEALGKLPETERLEWQKLWEGVMALDKQAADSQSQ